MNLQQLRFFNEIVRQGLNISNAASALYTSQPGVSKQIRLLEEELGVDIFVRNGKRVVDTTEAGRTVLAIAERVLLEAANLRQAGRDFNDEDAGALTIATTHTQARYVLPAVVKRFFERYPRVRLTLHQGNPTQVASDVAAGRADIAIATEAIELYPDLVMLPCYQWNRVVIVPPGHELLDGTRLTLERLARHPLITYDFAFTGRSKINHAFATHGLTPNVVITALDSDVIKTYVELGMGVGLIAHMAFDAARDTGLRAIDAHSLFESSTTRIGIRRGAFLRKYTYDFIAMFAPQLDRRTVDRAMTGAGSSYEL